MNVRNAFVKLSIAPVRQDLEWSYNDAQAWTQLEADLKSRFDKQIQKVKVFCSWKVIAGKYERLLTSEKSSSISLGHYEQLRFFSDRHFWKSRN